MKKIVYIGVIGVGVCVLAGLFVYQFIYNKPHKNVHEMSADYSISAAALIEDFDTDEQDANQKYLDKIIQVKGKIYKIDTTDGKSVVTLGDSNMLGSVICTMDPGDNKIVGGLRKDQDVEVRGICTGYLMDVMLVRAVIVK